MRVFVARFAWVLITVGLAFGMAACGSDDGTKSLADAAPDGGRADGASDRPIEAPPAPAALGEACTEDSGCLSGICANSVCCSSACGGACRRCDVAGQLGTCALVPAGTACGGNICADLTAFRPQAVCDETGGCGMPAVITCAPGRCLDDACVVVCSRDDECQSPATCQGGRCRVGDGGVGDAGADAPDASAD